MLNHTRMHERYAFCYTALFGFRVRIGRPKMEMLVQEWGS
jgi:hypothetical protein